TAVNLGVNVSQSGAVNPSYSYAWKALKNNVLFASGNSNSFSFTPDDNSVYQVSVTVTDALGLSGSASQNLTVDNVVPTAVAGGPYSGAPGASIAFAGSGSDPSTADTLAGLSYSWNFGDGSTGTGKSVSHTYATAGTYTATLTVGDKDGGVSTSTTSVTVSST